MDVVVEEVHPVDVVVEEVVMVAAVVGGCGGGGMLGGGAWYSPECAAPQASSKTASRCWSCLMP